MRACAKDQENLKLFNVLAWKMQKKSQNTKNIKNVRTLRELAMKMLLLRRWYQDPCTKIHLMFGVQQSSNNHNYVFPLVMLVESESICPVMPIRV